MLRARTWSVILFVGALLLALGPPVPAQLEQARAQISYEQGSSFAGSGRVSCESLAMIPSAARGGSLDIDSTGGQWIHHTYRYNYTMVMVPKWTAWGRVLDDHLYTASAAVPDGPFSLEWGAQARVLIMGALSPDWRHAAPLNVVAQTTAYDAGAADGMLPRVTAYEDTGARVRQLGPAASGLSRVVRFADGQVRIDGAVSMLLEGARLVDSAGTVLEVPARYEFRTHEGDARLAAVGSTLEHYARLDLPSASMRFDARDFAFYCRSLHADLAGSLRVYHADGRLATDTVRTEFEDREVLLNGSYRLDERPTADGVQGNATGVFESASVDFHPAVAPAPYAFATKVGFWTLLGSAVLAALYQAVRFALPLFSRFTPDGVSEHPTRRLILDAVRQRPNITFQELVSSVGETRGEVRHHVRMLEVHGLLRSHRVGARRCLVGKETIQKLGRAATDLTPAVVGLVDPLAEAVAAQAQGPRPMGDIVQHLCVSFGVSKVGAWKAVRRAEKLGFVTRVKEHGRIWIQCA